jgi:hypothetical protein
MFCLFLRLLMNYLKQGFLLLLHRLRLRQPNLDVRHRHALIRILLEIQNHKFQNLLVDLVEYLYLLDLEIDLLLLLLQNHLEVRLDLDQYILLQQRRL